MNRERGIKPLIPFLFLFLTSLTACSHNNTPESPSVTSLNDSSLFTNNGYMLLKRKNYALALEEFNKAIQLKPHDNSAHIGKAKVLLKHHKLKEAFQELEHAEKHATDKEGQLQVIAAKIQYYANPSFVKLHHGENAWFIMSKQEFDKAAKIKKDNRVFFEMARAYKMNFMFVDARKVLKEIISNNNPYTLRAKEEMQAIQLAEHIVKSYPNVKPLLFQGALNRGQLAFLLIEAFSLHEDPRIGCSVKKIASRKGSFTYEHSSDIEKLLSCSLRGLNFKKDGSFHAKEPISRASLAFLLAELYHKVHPQATAPQQNLPPFSDVQDDDWFAPSIRFCHAYGLMKEEDSLTMEFRPYEGISITEAMVTLDYFFTTLL